MTSQLHGEEVLAGRVDQTKEKAVPSVKEEVKRHREGRGSSRVLHEAEGWVGIVISHCCGHGLFPLTCSWKIFLLEVGSMLKLGPLRDEGRLCGPSYHRSHSACQARPQPTGSCELGKGSCLHPNNPEYTPSPHLSGI